MAYAVRLDEEYASVIGRHVDEGEAISPGMPLVDIMTPEGLVMTLVSEGWGIVAHVEGQRILGEDTGNTPAGSGDTTLFPQHSVLCHIVARSDHNSIKGGKPHPSTSRSVSNAKAEGRLLPTFG